MAPDSTSIATNIDITNFKNSSGYGHLSDKISFTLRATSLLVSMTTCSKCSACNEPAYDEQIAVGWSPLCDAETVTHCPHCRARMLLPRLTIRVFAETVGMSSQQQARCVVPPSYPASCGQSYSRVQSPNRTTSRKMAVRPSLAFPKGGLQFLTPLGLVNISSGSRTITVQCNFDTLATTPHCREGP
ncbi:unnamed protein product [Protopolystoma xenopodis]|uniref:Uncharacterized protein n=1 Tax=Protopolystoma xenopodis TaxID=117903 RepID=A0A3S5A623_9PLAT|nr:unnamed protein product [Protopolystoma xenopodis]